MMKSTIATILGTAALGLLKKQMGSSTRLVKKTEYEYMMYFILFQEGYNWQTDTLAMESMKDKLYDILIALAHEDDDYGQYDEFVNELYSTLFDPFIIYTPCAKYTAQFRKRRINPQENKTMEKLTYIVGALDSVPEVWFHKEEYAPIDPETFNEEFWLIKDSIIKNVLNKFYSLVNRRFPDLNCKAKWKLLDEEFAATEIYSHFMNSDGNYPEALQYHELGFFGEEVLLEGDEYDEQSYSAWSVYREEKIYNVDTGEEYKPSEPKTSRLRRR